MCLKKTTTDSGLRNEVFLMLAGESNVKKPKPKLHSTIKLFKWRAGHSQPNFKFLNLKIIYDEHVNVQQIQQAFCSEW